MVFAFKTIRSVALAFAYLDQKAMFLLYQGVDESTFDKIAKAKWSRESMEDPNFLQGSWLREKSSFTNSMSWD